MLTLQQAHARLKQAAPAGASISIGDELWWHGEKPPELTYRVFVVVDGKCVHSCNERCLETAVGIVLGKLGVIESKPVAAIDAELAELV